MGFWTRDIPHVHSSSEVTRRQRKGGSSPCSASKTRPDAWGELAVKLHVIGDSSPFPHLANRVAESSWEATLVGLWSYLRRSQQSCYWCYWWTSNVTWWTKFQKSVVKELHVNIMKIYGAIVVVHFEVRTGSKPLKQWFRLNISERPGRSQYVDQNMLK